MSKSTYAQNGKFSPVVSIPLVNTLNWSKVEVRRFQSEKFVFTVQVDKKRYKIFQVVFGKSDGSLYVTFPYFDISEGILSVGTMPALVTSSQVNLQTMGKVTSKKVKYAHHPDGEAHFSQAGKVATSIRRKSIPLSEAEGHIFSIHAQGLSHFEIDPTENDHPPTMKQISLNFPCDQKEPEAFKMLGRWYKATTLARGCSFDRGYFFGPQVPAQTPDGHIIPAFLIGTPKGQLLEKHILVISCQTITRLDRDKEALLNFIGGFDAPAKNNDLRQTSSFLCVNYPVSNYEEVSKRIGSIDIAHAEYESPPPPLPRRNLPIHPL